MPSKQLVQYKSPFRFEDLAEVLSDRSGSLSTIAHAIDIYGDVGHALLKDKGVLQAVTVTQIECTSVQVFGWQQLQSQPPPLSTPDHLVLQGCEVNKSSD